MRLNKREIQVIRTLAQEYMQLALMPRQEETKKLWYSINDGTMQRPMVLIDQVCWEEMDVDGSLKCEVKDPWWRGVEYQLRRDIYQAKHMPADRVFEPWILIDLPVENSGWGVDVDRTVARHEDNEALSMVFHNQLEDWEDLEKIKIPHLSRCPLEEYTITQEANEVFNGVAPWKWRGICMHLGVWDTISQWMNVENCYIEIMDRPEFVHAIMEKMTLGLENMIADADAQSMFDVTGNVCHCSHTYSSDFQEGREGRVKNAWAFGLAQLFTSVSPKVTEEFEVKYMQRIFKKFGAVYYGCCDRLDDRLDVIDKLPNVRKISCSPWSERERFAANLPKKYIMSNKPTPALLATDVFHEDQVRADIRRTIQAARAHDVRLELILKDISTVRRQPQRLWRWAEIAMEEVGKA